MSKNKIGPTNPWVYGKGKDLKQSIGSGKNASVLDSFLSQMPKQATPIEYPTEIFQDALSSRNYNTTKPAQAVLGDFTETLADGTVKKGSYLPAVINEPPRSYPNQIFQDDAFNARSGTRAVFGGSDYLPTVVQNADDAARPAIGMVDDVIRPIANQGVKAGTKIAAGITAGLPGVMDIVMPEYVNASEANEVQKMKDEAFYKQYPVAPNEELRAMLGMPVNVDNSVISQMPPEQMISSEINLPPAARSIAGGENGNGLPSGGEVSNTSNQSPINTQSQTIRKNPSNSSLGGSPSAGRRSPEDDYRQLLQHQMNAIGASGANKSAFNYLDLSPLNAFVDNMTGSNLSQSYNGPKESATKDMSNVNSLAKQIADYDMKKKEQDNEIRKAILDRESDFKKLIFANKLGMERDAANRTGLSSGLKPMQVIQVKENFNKNTEKIKSYLDFNDKLDSYLNVIKDLEGTVLTGPMRDRVASVYEDMQIAYKEAARLGALTGPDLGIMEGVNRPVYGWKGAVNEFVGGGVPEAVKSAERLKTQSRDRVAKELEEIGAMYSTIPGVVDDQMKLFRGRLDNMTKQQAVYGRGPSKNIPTSDKLSTRTPASDDLSARVKAALEKAKSTKAQ